MNNTARIDHFFPRQPRPARPQAARQFPHRLGRHAGPGRLLPLAWLVCLWCVLPAPAQAQTAGPAPAVQATEAPAPALRLPSAADLGVEVPRPVKAATALLGLGRQRLALVVGNAKLGGRDVLDSAYRDSRAVAAALRAGGFVVMAREDLTARDLRASLLEFRSRLQPGGIGFIYVAALGAQVDGRNLLLPREIELPQDGSPSEVAAGLKAGGVPVSELVDALIGTPDSPRLLVVDAAYQHPVLARLPAPGLAEQRLPPGMMALFGHALHSVQDVPAAAPLGDKPPDDPREIAASTFGRVLVGAMLTSRIKPHDMLRRTRTALFDASGGAMAPWLSGETAGEEEFAEEPITALLPRTPEELAREAIRRVVRNLIRVQGGSGTAALLPPPAPGLATAPSNGLVAAGQAGVDGMVQQVSPAPDGPQAQAQTPDGTRQALRHQVSKPLADSVPGPGNVAGNVAGSLGSAAGAAASTVASTVAGAAGLAATVGAVASAGAALNAAGTAATATVGAVGTAGSLLANAVALGARVTGGGAVEPARASLQAASTLSGSAVSAASTAAAAGTATTAAATSAAGAVSAATAASTLAAVGSGLLPDATAAAAPATSAATPSAAAAGGAPVAAGTAGGTAAGTAAGTAGTTVPAADAAAAAAPAGTTAAPGAAVVPTAPGVAPPGGGPAGAGGALPAVPATASVPPGTAAAAAPALPGTAATASAASSLVPEAPVEPATSGPPVLAPPKFNAYGYGEGDAFLYQVTDVATEQVTGTFMQAIEQVAPDGSLVGNGSLLQLDPQGRLQTIQRPDGTLARFEPYQDLWQARPQAGQTREVRFKELFQRPDGSRGVIEWQGSSEVGRAAKVRTPSGEYEALPIETAGRFVEAAEGGERTYGRWKRTVWYSPSLGHPVAIDLQDFDRYGRSFRSQRIELMNAQRTPRQP